MAKYDLFGKYVRHYEVTIRIQNSKERPLLVENFTTKREAFAFIDSFCKIYSGFDNLDVFVYHFDKYGFVDNSWRLNYIYMY